MMTNLKQLAWFSLRAPLHAGYAKAVRCLSRLSISARLITVLAIGFTYQASISVVSLMHLRQSLMQQRATGFTYQAGAAKPARQCC